jgi:hypothetical protein
MAFIQEALKEGTAAGAAEAVKISLNAGQIAGGSATAAAAGVIVSQMEYNGKKADIAELYKKELAAQLGKSEQAITSGDLETVAQKNRTLAEELVKAKKQRNLNIGVISVATLVSVGLATAIITGLGIGVTAGFWPFMAAAAITTLAYMVIKEPLKKIGEKIVGIGQKTTGERIEEIQKEHENGKVISRERVFSVFVQANPQLDQFIQEHYGKKYNKLKVAQKLEITEAIGSQLGVAKITDDINKGRIQATELAFAVDGVQSGVAESIGDEPKKGVMGTIKKELGKVAEAVGYHPADDKPEGFSFSQRERERRAAAQLQR